MSHSLRWARAAVITLVALLLMVVVGGWFLVNSGWLRDRIRLAIIDRAETATGGRVEIGKFDFNLGTMTATVENLVIHGREAADVAPLLAVSKVTIQLKVIQFVMRRDIRLQAIDVQQPKAHIIVDRSGRTNLPEPKTRSDKNSVEEILNLRIAKVLVKDGVVLAEAPDAAPKKMPWNAVGENLAAQIAYDTRGLRYEGDVAIAPLHASWDGYGPADIAVKAHAALEKTRVVVTTASVDVVGSHIEISNGLVEGLTAPVVTAEFSVTGSASEAGKLLHLKSPPAGNFSVSAGRVRFTAPGEIAYSGQFESTAMTWQGIRNARIATAVNGTGTKLSLTAVRIAALGGTAGGDVEVFDYKTFKGSGTVNRLSVRSAAALRMAKVLPYDGLVSGKWNAAGAIAGLETGQFTGDVQLSITPVASGPAVHGEIAAAFHQNELDLGRSWLQLPSTRIDVTGTLGKQLAVKLDTHDLNDLLPAIGRESLPVALRNGAASFEGTVTGSLENPRAHGKVLAQGVVYAGYEIGSVSATAEASKSGLTVSGGSGSVNGLAVRAQGSVGMADWAITDASAIDVTGSVENAGAAQVLELAGVASIPLAGIVTANGHVVGTVGAPRGTATYSVRQGSIYRQPFDAVTGSAEYQGRDSQTVTAVVALGENRVNVSARMGAGGAVSLTASSNAVPLSQILLVSERQPGIGGTIQVQGKAQLHTAKDAKGVMQVDLVSVDGDAGVKAIQLEGRSLGDAAFTARTENGSVALQFTSNAASAVIDGNATVRLSGDYQGSGVLNFTNAGLRAIALLAAKPGDAKNFNFDGSAEGTIRFSGPLTHSDQLTAQMEIRQLEVHPLNGAPFAGGLPAGYGLRNAEPVRISLDKSEIRVESAHMTGPNTDLRVEGTAALSANAPMNLRVNGTLDLAIARTGDLIPSGTLRVNGTARGWTDFSGRASLVNGAFRYADIPNAITNAQAEIVFTGNRANIESFKAETGGGTVQATGFAAVAGDIVTFQITANANDVRVRYPEGVSSVSDAHLILAGTSRRSQAQGSIVVRRLVVNPDQDARSILASVAAPVKTPTASTGLLSALHLDVQIQTAPDIALQSSVAQSIQVESRNLRLSGTATNPSLLGRIDITQGEILFYGNKYKVSQGAVSFVNPVKIEPILNIDLETRARGVDVTLTVTGPASKLNLSYRSDPPFEFSEIVALLATGRSPDSSTVARSTPTDPSALIGQVVANPVAGRLQRFFGVSRLKIDPQFTGSTGARLTIEQQISPDILFTYVTDVAHTSTQLIRVEWDLSPNWSAILVREENGYVGLDFAYRKRLK